MQRVTQLFLVAALAALLSPAVASSAPRMYVGFHDDVAFRWNDNRTQVLDQARGANATIVRTLVDWSKTAPTRPANPTNSFDPAYRFDDVDELVRNAQQRGLEVIITIWGTPKWANGGKTPNVVPRNARDLQNFARAIASRYSGRLKEFPYVGRYSIWNESNLQLFLSPQFDSKGRSVGPRHYARMYAAAYAGIKAGNARAKVAIGSTSSHGRDKKLNGKSDTHSPGRFAQLVAAANPRLKFDAWAQHPYPVPVSQGPAQRVRYPNVAFSTLARFERDLDTWFKRKNIPIWVTEYGNETRPGEPKGVTEAQQARYAPQAIALAKKDKRVAMFVWFVFRDSSGSPWQSGLHRANGAAKPAAARWAAAARGVDRLNGKLTVRGGTANPAVTVHIRDLCTNNVPGTLVGVTVKTFQGASLVQSGQPATTLALDCTITIRLTGLVVAKGRTYRAEIDANTATTAPKRRVLTIVGS